MCINHCYIEKTDVTYLNSLGVNIEYKEQYGILDVLYNLTDTKAIEYIIEKYKSKFEYYNVYLKKIVYNMDISDDVKQYIIETYKLHKEIDYENFDADVLYEYNEDDPDIGLIEEIISKVNSVDVTYEKYASSIMEAVINKKDIDAYTIKYTWEIVRNYLC